MNKQTLAPAVSIRYRIFDLTGKELAKGEAEGDVLRIDIASLASGIYLLHITNNQSGQSLIRRFCKVE